MANSPLIPLSDYLTTSFRPDREYVDGVLVERNVGKNEHSRLQSLLAGVVRIAGRSLAGSLFHRMSSPGFTDSRTDT
jgi:hypothetical protein